MSEFKTPADIIATLEELPPRDSDRVQVYIPRDQAATCVDCEGVFLRTAGKCPGCGCKQFVLASRINDPVIVEEPRP